MPPVRPQRAAQAQQPTSAARMGAGAPLTVSARGERAPPLAGCRQLLATGRASAAPPPAAAEPEKTRGGQQPGRGDGTPFSAVERSCRSVGKRRGASDTARATGSRGERRRPAEIRAASAAVALLSPFPAPPAAFLPRGGAPGAAGRGRPLLAGRAGSGRRRAAARGGGEGAGRGGGGTHVLCTCRSISRISVNLSRRSMGSCSITAGTRREGRGREGGGVSRSPPWGRGRRHVAAPSPRLPSAGRARPPGVPVPHTLTLQIVLQIQHGGGRASAKGLLANGGSSLPIWRRRQQHRRLDSAKTTLAADGARLGRAAIGCPRP